MKNTKRRIVHYPNVLHKNFFTIKELEDVMRPVASMAKNEKELPEKTMFDFSTSCGVTYFHIITPDGRIFTGAAFKKSGDRPDLKQAMLIAGGRALAVWRACHEADNAATPMHGITEAIPYWDNIKMYCK